MQKTPASASTPTGVRIHHSLRRDRPANPLSGNRAVVSRRIHSDLPLLPHHLQTVWKAQKRPTAVPLQPVPQDLHRRARTALGRNAPSPGPGRGRPETALGRHERSQCRARDRRPPRHHPPAAHPGRGTLPAAHEEKIKGLDVRDVQVDEIWGFVQKKEGHRWEYEKDVREIGDAYCFVGIERNTKLVLAYHLGKRDTPATDAFIGKLAYATSDSRYQLTSDGFKPYIKSVKMLLRGRVDFAQLVKVYGSPREGEQRYSPAEVVDSVPYEIMGRPVRNRICTSHIERQNLSIRMGMRRMTRLTNGFSKKWENLEAAYALWFAFYNFCRVHKTLRITPAMEAGIADHAWSISEIIG